MAAPNETNGVGRITVNKQMAETICASGQRRFAEFFLNKMYGKIGFEMSLIIVEAIRGRCASFMIQMATVSEIYGGQTNSSVLVV